MKKIRVYGCSNIPETKNTLRRATVYFLDLLLPRKRKIDVRISVENKLIEKESMFGGCYHLSSSPSRYHIRLDDAMDSKTMVTTLAHEFVHVRQFDSGELAFRHSCNRWHGTYYPSDEFSYEDEPWEIEASSLEDLLAKNFFTQ
jgi:hypothetical protein